MVIQEHTDKLDRHRETLRVGSIESLLASPNRSDEDEDFNRVWSLGLNETGSRKESGR